MTRLQHYKELRNKGLTRLKAKEVSGLRLQPFFIGAAIIAALALIFLLADHYAEKKAAHFKVLASENLRAFELAMKGRPFLIEGEHRALLTCPALETKL